LNPVTDPRSYIFHESLRCGRTAITKHVRNNQLCVGINRRPRPAVSRAFLHLFCGNILLLRIDEGPHFVALGATYAKVPHVRIVEGSTGASGIFQEAQYGVFSNSEHPARRVN
jgi:hypothetical protein